jgi:hypothetical protein
MNTKYYYPYPYGLEFLLVGLLGILGGVIFSTNNINITNQSASNNSADTVATTSDGKKWDLLWLQEGKGCQNWSNDTANRGGSAYTCLGITQSAWELYLRGAGAGQGLPSTTKGAYDKLGESGFKKHAIVIYERQYCKPTNCNKYSDPIPAVILAISANGGPGTANRWLRATANISDPKQRARKIAELEHNRLDAIASRDPSQRGFRRGGWNENIKNRYSYIDKF